MYIGVNGIEALPSPYTETEFKPPPTNDTIPWVVMDDVPVPPAETLPALDEAKVSEKVIPVTAESVDWPCVIPLSTKVGSTALEAAVPGKISAAPIYLIRGRVY